MKKIYFLIAFVLVGIIYTDSFGQKTKSKSTAISGGSTAGKFGVGVRLGDPLGLTFKKYFNTAAIELNIGRTFYWGYDYDRLDRYYYYDYRNYPGYYFYNDSRYRHRYYNQRSLSFQLHILSQKNISSVSGLQWYFGGGPQLRTFSYDFEYYDQFRRRYYERETQVGIGIDGVIGLEYTFEEIPITVFGDMNLYIEFIHNPFWFALQGAVGGRFNF